MSIRDILTALKFIELTRAVYVGILRLKLGQKGDRVVFSGIKLKVDGINVEIRGEIIRLE